MLSVQRACLGAVAVKQALTYQTAAGEGYEALGRVPPLVQTLGVNAGVKKHQNTQPLLFRQKLGPQNGRCHRNTAACDQKPDDLHTAGKDHADKDENEDQGNTQVPGNDHVYAKH